MFWMIASAHRTARRGLEVLGFLVALAAAGTPPAAAKPARIVSLNSCPDQLLLALADRDRIRSLSHLAADPLTSALAREAAGIPLNHGLSEEILPLKPDLVLASAFTTRSTVWLLRKLGFPVLALPVAASLADIRANIRTVATAIGEPARGEALVAAFDRKLPRLEPGPRPLAVLFWANGYTSGTDTLANAVIEAAGFRTLGRELGLTGLSQLPLEVLLTSGADVLILSRHGPAPALANQTARHPALRRFFASRRTVSVPDRLWVCGTPVVAEAIARLKAVRDELRQAREAGQ